MPTVAETLREAREAQNLSVHDVANKTKIKTEHVRALDDGNYNVFSAPVFIRGFVRSYGRMLKVDETVLMSTLEAELAGNEKFSEPPPLTRKSRGSLDYLMLRLSQVNWRWVLPLIGLATLTLLVLFGYQAWKRHQIRDPLEHLGPGRYTPSEEASGLYLPVPNEPAQE